MLENLHVKNFAIIDEIDVDFGPHLNILTGETGAGKSILIGSVNIVLGARVSPEMIGRYGDSALVEAVFHVESQSAREKIRDCGVEPEEGEIIISRRITGSRSVNKINGVTVPVSTIRAISEYLIDIHGQHEHQSLLNEKRHRQIVDDFGGKELREQKEKVHDLYKQYRHTLQESQSGELSAEEQARRKDYLLYEIREIEEASLTEEEMLTIEDDFRKMSNGEHIVDQLSEAYRHCKEEAADAIGRAVQNMQNVSEYEKELGSYTDELMQIESRLSDFNREISGYMSDITFDPGELMQLQNRLDQIRSLQTKYGESYEEITEHGEKARDELEKLEEYEAYRSSLLETLKQQEEELQKEAVGLTKLREKSAAALQKKITQALMDLNFAHVDFDVEIRKAERITDQGADEVEFMIATNPGEPRKSLQKVASGGELSRIMLAIKSVFADKDGIESLIFDEIDTGISGRTAQKVSEKMTALGASHQILCITHLPQIAAMADEHFVIEKVVKKDRSVTGIRRLTEVEIEDELARILGGVEITDAVRASAREMRQMAAGLKKYKKS